MARPPKNKIKENRFTQGGDFVYANTEQQGLPYFGFYYIGNDGLPYPGKDFLDNIKNYKNVKLDLKPVDQLDIFGFKRTSQKIQNILNKTANTVGWATNAYFFAKNNLDTAKQISAEVRNKKIIKRVSEGDDAIVGVHYYARKNPQTPIPQSNPTDLNPVAIQWLKEHSIKEVDESNYEELSQNPIYVTVSIDYSSLELFKQVEEAEKQIPGIKVFLGIS